MEEKIACNEMLQRNVTEETSERRKSEYKAWKKEVKELVDESKMKVDEEFGRKLGGGVHGQQKIILAGGEKSYLIKTRENVPDSSGEEREM